MEATAITAIANIIIALGPGGIMAAAVVPGLGLSIIVLVLYYFNSKKSSNLLSEYQKDMRFALAQYAAHQEETRQMYRDNVELVKDWKRVAGDLHETVVLNTRTMQKITDKVDSNQFCPLVKKESRA